MGYLKKILKHLNFWQQAKELGLPVWELPNFLFLVMGGLTIIVMFATYFSAIAYDDPALLVASVSMVAVFILAIGTAIIRSVERVAEASRIKSEFISVASHELKTPLSAIKWALDMLLSYKKQGFSVEQTEYLTAINDNNERLIKLTGDLLDISRIESGTFKLNPEKGSITILIKDLVQEFQPLAKTLNISLTFSPPDKEIPDVLFDSERIRIVLKNLIDNAIKYIRDRGNVDLSVARDGGKIIIRIKDTGVGIPRHDRQFIFSKFYRSSNKLLYQTQGAGLGLFMARAFVKSSGGKIGFESDEKTGSIFWFSLPINA